MGSCYTKSEVEKILKIVSDAIDCRDYVLLGRSKNNLMCIGYTINLFEYTIKSLTYANYIEGPNYNALHDNNVWIFGYDDVELNIQIYIKFSLSTAGRNICFISFHEAEYKLRYFNWR